MTYTAKVTSKGQLTIPSEVRDALNIKKGDVIYFDILSEKDKKARITASSVQDTIDTLYGSLGEDVEYIPYRKARKIAGKKLAEKYKAS